MTHNRGYWVIGVGDLAKALKSVSPDQQKIIVGFLTSRAASEAGFVQPAGTDLGALREDIEATLRRE